ncbi:MAG: hypothetical protein ACOYVF_06210 [Candidatus Zixiibacteriota bacterium]
MLKKVLYHLISILTLSFINFTGGCDDHDYPTVPGKAKDYPVYFCDPAGNPAKLFTFYPIAKRVDSIDIQWNLDLIKVSADGQLLYIYDNNYSSPSFVVRADDLTNVADLPGPVYGVSPDN